MAGVAASALGTNIMRAQQAPAPPVSPSPVTPAVAPVAASEPSTTHDVAPAVAPTHSTSRIPQEALAPAAVATPREAQPVLAAVEGSSSTRPTAAASEGRAPAIAAVVTSVRVAGDQASAMSAATAVVARQASAATARILRSSQDSVGNFTWSHNGEKLQINYRGEIEFTDDDADVKRLSPGGHLKIKDGGWLGGRTVEFRADPSGKLERRYWVGTSERPFEPEGRQWLAQVLPRFIRQSGIGAPARVTRLLQASGPSAVLAEITRISGSWAKRVYFTELLRQAALTPETARLTLVQAGREIDSDFELASLLIAAADKLLVDEPTRKAYFEAARSIESDFEMRRVYSSALGRGPVSASRLAGILEASRSIESDFEQAALLGQIVKLQPLDQTTRGPFFAALAGVDSDFEHRRVLGLLAERTDLTPEVVRAMLDSAATLQSDFELASLLTQFARAHGAEGPLRAPFFAAVESIGSAFERGRVLQSLARRPDVSAETVMSILKSVRGVNSSHEASQVLLAVAAAHTIAGAARDLYIDAAEKLGDFEQGRVLTALVKSERRK
jgi:hypothetical protein